MIRAGEQDSRQNFEELLRLGNQGEEEVVRFLRGRGYHLHSRNNDFRFDLVFETPAGHPQTWEVKTDTTMSPNLAIEVWSYGKPSGVYRTEALKLGYFFAKTGELFELDVDAVRAHLLEHILTIPTKPVRALSGNDTFVRLIRKSDVERFRLGVRHELPPLDTPTISVLGQI